MTNLGRSLIVALGLVASCKAETARKADKAADRMVDRKAAVVDDSGYLANAASDFARHRQIRVQALRAEHALISTQPMVINMMAAALPLTDPGRADVEEKLQLLQTRLDAAGNLITGLQSVTADDWRASDDAVTDAMTRLNDARKDAWKTLDTAPRTDRAS